MIVVDTNILAYRTIKGTRNNEAWALAARDPEWAAPELCRSELRNVVTGYVRRGSITLAEAAKIMSEMTAVLLAGLHQVPDSIVFDLITKSRCTSYDCEFVALAMMLDTKLITEDAELLRAFPNRCRSLAQALAG